MDEARRLRSSGASYFQIAQTVGASLRSVCHYLSLPPESDEWEDGVRSRYRLRSLKPAQTSNEVATVRSVDQLGRVVLPSDTRDKLGIKPGVQMEFFVENDSLIIRKYEPGCTFCGSPEAVSAFRGRLICTGCRDALTAVSRRR